MAGNYPDGFTQADHDREFAYHDPEPCRTCRGDREEHEPGCPESAETPTCRKCRGICTTPDADPDGFNICCLCAALVPACEECENRFPEGPEGEDHQRILWT